MKQIKCLVCRPFNIAPSFLGARGYRKFTKPIPNIFDSAHSADIKVHPHGMQETVRFAADITTNAESCPMWAPLQVFSPVATYLSANI